jgi:hypothetical protein
MFEASVDGQAYDADRWAQYYKPGGMTTKPDAEDEVATPPARPTAARPAPAPVAEASDDEDATPPFDAEPAEASDAPKVTSGSTKAEDILAMIRNRQK